MIYVAMFIVSVLCLQWSSKSIRKVGKEILFWIAVALPVLMATFRSNDVGIDVNIYIRPYSVLAQNEAFASYMVAMLSQQVEVGYAIVNYVGAHIGGLQGSFFLIELLVILPVYFRISKEKDINVWLAAFIYLCLFYNMSLNIARQSIALSIVFFSLKYIREKNYWKATIVILVACTFHFSAVIGLSYFVFELVNKGKEWRIKQSIIILGVICMIVFYDEIAAILFKLIFGETNKYTNAFLKSETGYLSFWNIVLNTAFLLIILINKSFLMKQDNYRWYQIDSIFNFIVYLLTAYNGNAFRYALYFSIFMPIAIPTLRYRFVKENRRYIDFVLAILILLYWYNFNTLANGHGTYPYTSIF